MTQTRIQASSMYTYISIYISAFTHIVLYIVDKCAAVVQQTCHTRAWRVCVCLCVCVTCAHYARKWTHGTLEVHSTEAPYVQQESLCAFAGQTLHSHRVFARARAVHLPAKCACARGKRSQDASKRTCRCVLLRLCR